jgi:tetratricopeptide (TPR) repeat protein
MRTLDRRRVARALDLAEKVMALDPADRIARQEHARLLILSGKLAEAGDRVTAETVEDATPTSTDWWLISAEVQIRAGRIDQAIGDAKRAHAAAPQNAAAIAMLGMLYAVTGDFSSSYTLLEPLVAKPANTDEDKKDDRDDSLTDAELGRVLLHAYISLRRSSRLSLARDILEKFSDTYKGKNPAFVQSIYRNPVIGLLWGEGGPGQIGVQSPWAHIVAQYLRGRDGYEKLMIDFRKNAETNDPRDAAAFDCQLHFYLGIARTFAKDAKGAAAEFDLALATEKTELIEFWFAKHEKESLAGAAVK